jgi:orotate phosphoribosyltransferase
MNDTERAKRILSDVGAVMTHDHFVYTSGLHGPQYINKDIVFSDTLHMEEIGKIFKNLYPFGAIHPEVILGPAVGGAILAQWVAKAFSAEDAMYRYPVYAAYADKDGDQMVIRRGYDKLIKGKRVLVVEDILNTGISAIKTITAARACEADIIGVAAICNRGGLVAASLGVNMLYSLVDVDMQTYPPDKCPLCEERIPINTAVGHGQKYLDSLASIDENRGDHPLPG